MDGKLNWSIDYYNANTSECNRIIQSMENFDRVPILTRESLHHFKDGDLVRYRGMVQDMFNPEFYYASYRVKNSTTGDVTVKSGKYRDIADCQANEELNLDGNVPEERLVYFCIPIPGMTTWVQDMCKNMNGCPGQGDKKTSESGKKRAMDEDVNNDGMELGDDGGESSKGAKTRRQEGETMGEGSKNENHSCDKYFPLDNKDGMACIVKIYESEEKCDVSLNDRIEVIGFISLDPSLEMPPECEADDKALNPPPSLVPRLHSVHARKLVHNNPLLSQKINSAEIVATAETVRSDLHLILTQVLYGDSLAADYIICHMLSRVYARNDGAALGKFSMNLSNIPNRTFGKRFYDLMENLVTNSEYVPLSIKSLNEKYFVPKKDYETLRLLSGRLQLADDTHLVVDETGMDEGKLLHIGCLNVMALQELIRDQELAYDFSYHTVKYNTNIPVLVLSEGKSMLETDVLVKLKPETAVNESEDETFDGARFFLNGGASERIRKYLTCMRHHEFGMKKDVMDQVAEDYVQMRHERPGVNATDLHTLLVLSRLLALSHGRVELTSADWKRALEMESDRKSRIS